ncbi:hypothetical protein BN1183_BE_00680 [Pantoea ananatis]|nr:hypothetical protein BN1183_BE_00680 [Pantoea ananatis]
MNLQSRRCYEGFSVSSYTEISHDTLLIRLQSAASRAPCCRGCNRSTPHIHDTSL